MNKTFWIIGGVAGAAILFWYWNSNNKAAASATQSGGSAGNSGPSIPSNIPSTQPPPPPPPAPKPAVAASAPQPTYPVGLTEGEYVKGTAPDIYMLRMGYRIPMNAGYWTSHFGNSMSNVTQIDDFTLSYVPIKAQI